MKKNFLKSIMAVLALSLGALVSVQSVPANAAVATNAEFACTYSAASKDHPCMYYGSTDVITYTAAEAEAKGIPAGYEGNVFEVVGSTSKGALLDFSALELPVSLIDSISVRFYVGVNAANTSGKPQLRIPKPNAPDSWIYQPGSTASQAGVWTTETIEKDFSSAADANGNLAKFELCVRSNAKIPFYVDSITVNVVENDGVAPVITYQGDEIVTIALGAELALDVSAYDAQEKGGKPVEFVWGEGVALNEKGLPAAEGEYTLTMRAKDYFNNVAEKTLTVRVVQPDTQAPVVNLAITEMHVQAGTMPVFNVQVSDDRAIAEVTKVWSAGALDEYGKLTVGTHTYTITARDTSGNVTEKTLTVYVSVGEPDYDNVVDEEAMMSGLTVSFDGVTSDKTYRYGDTIEKPADPVKETDEFVYTFIGWYNGDVEWDFASDVIQGNLELVSKWEQTPVENPSGGNDSGDSSEDEENENNPSGGENGDNNSSNGANNNEEPEEGASKGCQSSIGLTASLAAMLVACFVMVKGKKEE